MRRRRRAPVNRCGVCGCRAAAGRTRWGAPICGACREAQELRGWLDQLREPVPTPEQHDTYVDRQPIPRPRRAWPPPTALHWVDRERVRRA